MGNGLLAVYTALLCLSTVVLMLRIIARSTRGNRLGPDDYLMVLAWVSLWPAELSSFEVFHANMVTQVLSVGIFVSTAIGSCAMTEE